MTRLIITREKIVGLLSKSLIEFGYPDATKEKCSVIYDEYKAGKRFPDVSHGVLSAFAESQLKEIEEQGPLP